MIKGTVYLNTPRTETFKRVTLEALFKPLF